MNYEESIAYIESLIPTLERPTLKRMQLFMQEHGDLQNKIRTFHVGGTNGKGSTATILDALLSSMNYKVGRFTGPHILRFNERFSIAGQTINDVEFARIATEAREHSQAFAKRHQDLGGLTWFEFLAAMAFFVFAENDVDCAVLEVGLGGRFDATNVAQNVEATIITNIDLDHTHILGDTATKIAFEKSGIMRKNVPVITSAQGEGLLELERRAQEVGANLILLPEGKADVVPLELESEIESALDHLALSGPHQRQNAEMAVAALMASPLGKSNRTFLAKLSDCLSRIYFAGRMQFLHNKFLIDGAHNPAGARALRRALDERLERNGRQDVYGYCFILGLFGNKDAHAYLRELLRKGDCVIAMEAEVRRTTYPKEEIVAFCQDLGIEAATANSMEEALKLAQSAGDEREVVATGSFAILKKFMLTLGWKTVEDGRVLVRP